MRLKPNCDNAYVYIYLQLSKTQNPASYLKEAVTYAETMGCP